MAEDTVVEDQTTSSGHTTKGTKMNVRLTKPRATGPLKKGLRLTLCSLGQLFHTQAQMPRTRVKNIAPVRDKAVPLDADLVKECTTTAAEERAVGEGMNCESYML